MVLHDKNPKILSNPISNLFSRKKPWKKGQVRFLKAITTWHRLGIWNYFSLFRMKTIHISLIFVKTICTLFMYELQYALHTCKLKPSIYYCWRPFCVTILHKMCIVNVFCKILSIFWILICYYVILKLTNFKMLNWIKEHNKEVNIIFLFWMWFKLLITFPNCVWMH